MCKKMPYPCKNIEYKLKIVELETKEPTFLSKQISIDSRDTGVSIVELVIKAIKELEYKTNEFNNRED